MCIRDRFRSRSCSIARGELCASIRATRRSRGKICAASCSGCWPSAREREGSDMRRLLFVLCLAVAAPWAFAQGTPNTVELTPTVGYWFGDTISRGTINTVPFDVTVDDAPSYGLRIAYRFTPSWAFEGFLARGRADLITGHRELFGCLLYTSPSPRDRT